MKVYTHNEKQICTEGTSLMGYTDASYQELVDIFGEHTECDGYKVDAEWVLEFEDGKVATIYNYKTGVNYLGSDGMPVEEIRDWYIGGFDDIVVSRVTDILKANKKEMLLGTYSDAKGFNPK